MPAWRNGLARWTSNPKVVGSTPTEGVDFVLRVMYEMHTPRLIGIQYLYLF